MTEEPSVDAIREGLASDDPESRREAIRSLVEGREDWEGLDHLVPDLVEALDDRTNACHALDALHGMSEDEPEAVAPAVPEVVEFLEVREGLEGETPEAWLAEGTVVEHDSPATMRAHGKRRLRAVSLLGRVAEADPGAIADDAGVLVAVAGRGDHPEIRTDVLAILATVAEARPNAFEGGIEPIAAILESDADVTVRANAAFLLAILAEEHPESVADATASRGDAIREMLESDEDVAANAAVGLCAYVAEERPEAVEPMADSVLALLDHDLKSVRGNAVWTLAALDDEGIDERLASVAEDDPSEDVREHAAAVLDDRSAE
ncbi:hypothetical protein [Saliphagus infecundisoli]|uniref:HEAT repeat domain-containing protein n=1 Tax=Saliphagus infecundisoli TaxID=1849069 RepID=A0ABD5QFW1_9EURY|nr:hypothetical protein [Saliphagus infecundisoli]